MDVPFELFCKLVYRLGHPPLSSSPTTSKKPHVPPGRLFASWVAHLPRPLPAKTGKVLFRLLFPHEGSRRRYHLKEYRLAQELEGILGLRGLGSWDQVVLDGYRLERNERAEEVGTGCLGLEVKKRIKARHTQSPSAGLSIAQVDLLLDALAAHSPFSQLSQPAGSPPSATAVLTTLYRDSGFSPYAQAVLTQIILRDLWPLLDPLPRLTISNPTAMLALRTTSGPDQLYLLEATKLWDTTMYELWRGGKGNLDWCADTAERVAAMPSDPGLSTPAGASDIADGPLTGLNVPIPKCRKGRSISDALNPFLGSSKTLAARTVWAETKYDGYRMQIHVVLDHEHIAPRITIFSKSTRNSTAERGNTHSIIRAALDLPLSSAHSSNEHGLLRQRLDAGNATPSTRVSRSVILEAEVVPFNEGQREGGRGPGIEEFWWIEAAGVTVSLDQSGLPDIWRQKNRHLCLVFFDILHLDGRNLLREPYEARRRLLEEVIRPVPGFSMLAERVAINLDNGRQHALDTLHEVFGVHCATHQEGLILKAGDSAHIDDRWPWVKLKKDYIPDLGDCVDLLVLGAGWDVDRARELRVNTSVFTTFYLGVLTNRERSRSRTELPHFDILFRCSYGPDRTQLELYNHNIRSDRWRSKPYDRSDPFKRRLLGLSWTYRFSRGLPSPSILFETPLCAEVMGAGFLRLPNAAGEGERWEVRFPRLLKVWEHAERRWTDALDQSGLRDAAHKALGYVQDPALTTSPEHDSIRRAWRTSSAATLTDIPELPSPTSPRPPTPQKARHARSAPGSFAISKTSPPTPSPPDRDGGSAEHRVPLGTAKRLIQVVRHIRADEGDVDRESETTRKRKILLDSSPVPSSPKRSKSIALITPPPSSPVELRGRESIAGMLSRVVIQRNPMDQCRRRKPLSLRARMRTVVRQKLAYDAAYA